MLRNLFNIGYINDFHGDEIKSNIAINSNGEALKKKLI